MTVTSAQIVGDFYNLIGQDKSEEEERITFSPQKRFSHVNASKVCLMTHLDAHIIFSPTAPLLCIASVFTLCSNNNRGRHLHSLPKMNA